MCLNFKGVIAEGKDLLLNDTTASKGSGKAPCHANILASLPTAAPRNKTQHNTDLSPADKAEYLLPVNGSTALI